MTTASRSAYVEAQLLHAAAAGPRPSSALRQSSPVGAMVADSVRVSAPSLAGMWDTCMPAVLGEMRRRSAMRRLPNPSAIRVSTSRSREVSLPASGAGHVARAIWRPRGAALFAGTAGRRLGHRQRARPARRATGSAPIRSGGVARSPSADAGSSSRRAAVGSARAVQEVSRGLSGSVRPRGSALPSRAARHITRERPARI